VTHSFWVRSTEQVITRRCRLPRVAWCHLDVDAVHEGAGRCSSSSTCRCVLPLRKCTPAPDHHTHRRPHRSHHQQQSKQCPG
jgi:hypothetical protein